MSVKIKWVIAHEPEELFVRAANYFVKELEDRQPGKFDIEIMTKTGFAHRYRNGVVEDMDGLLKLAEEGHLDMCHTTTNSIGARYTNDFLALEMPFLFESHEHATAVLDGQVGRAMMGEIEKNGPMKSLAFTYSGGYRMLVGNTATPTLEDVASQVQRVNFGPIAKKTFAAIGAQTKSVHLGLSADAIGNGEIDSSECTYPRFYGMDFDKVASVINDTKHSLFATNIMITKEKWETLTNEEQQDFQTAASLCATKEREDSLEDINITSKRCAHDGYEIVTMSESERNRWKEATAPMYEELAHLFTPGLIDAIKDANPSKN